MKGFPLPDPQSVLDRNRLIDTIADAVRQAGTHVYVEGEDRADWHLADALSMHTDDGSVLTAEDIIRGAVVEGVNAYLEGRQLSWTFTANQDFSVGFDVPAAPRMEVSIDEDGVARVIPETLEHPDDDDARERNDNSLSCHRGEPDLEPISFFHSRPFPPARAVYTPYRIPAGGIRLLDIPDPDLREHLVGHLGRTGIIDIERVWVGPPEVAERFDTDTGETWNEVVCRFSGMPAAQTFSVVVETTPGGDPSYWPEGADKPGVVASGLSYSDAYRHAETVQHGLDDRDDYCDCDPDDCQCSRTSYLVYVEGDAA